MGGAVVRGRKENFLRDSITSVRAKCILDWILTLAKRRMQSDERDKLLVQFVRGIAPDEHKAEAINILNTHGVSYSLAYRDEFEEFSSRNFHPEVVTHARKLFLQGNYFHALFEAAKAYNREVKGKARSQRDGSNPVRLCNEQMELSLAENDSWE